MKSRRKSVSFLRKQESIDSRIRGNDRRASVACLIGAIMFLALLAPPALAKQPEAPLVDSATLVEHPDRYNNKIISFKGEAIGDVMERSVGAWININDDAYSRQGRRRRLAGFNSGQSVLISDKKAALAVKRLGDYNNRGDIVEVSGIFHKACPDHGGDMMIHSDSLRIVKAGFSLEHPTSTRKISLVIIWLALSGVILALWRRRTRTLRL